MVARKALSMPMTLAQPRAILYSKNPNFKWPFLEAGQGPPTRLFYVKISISVGWKQDYFGSRVDSVLE